MSINLIKDFLYKFCFDIMRKESKWSVDRKQRREKNQYHPRASRKQVFIIEDEEKLAGFPEAYAVHQEKQEIVSLGTMLTRGYGMLWDMTPAFRCSAGTSG